MQSLRALLEEMEQGAGIPAPPRLADVKPVLNELHIQNQALLKTRAREKIQQIRCEYDARLLALEQERLGMLEAIQNGEEKVALMQAEFDSRALEQRLAMEEYMIAWEQDLVRECDEKLVKMKRELDAVWEENKRQAEEIASLHALLRKSEWEKREIARGAREAEKKRMAEFEAKQRRAREERALESKLKLAQALEEMEL